MKKLIRPLIDARALGADCDNCSLNHQKPVPPEPAHGHPKLVILGAGPGHDENFTGRPMTGKLGLVVRDAVRDCGLREEDVHWTNATMCMAPRTMSQSDWGRAVKCCSGRLAAEIKESGATHIHAISKWASAGVGVKGGVDDTFGYPIPGTGPYTGTTITTNFWPVDARRAPFLVVLSRAVDGVEGRFEEWQWGEEHIEVGPEMLAALKSIRGGEVAVDIETLGKNNLTDKMSCIGVSDGRVSVSVPWHDYDAGKYGRVDGVAGASSGLWAEIRAEMLRILQEKSQITHILHNGGYDQVGLETHGIALGNFRHDTILAHSVVCQQLPHKLAFACSLAFPNFRWKEDFKVTDDAKGSEVYYKRDPLELRKYNARDASMTFLLWGWLKAQLDAFPGGWKLYEHSLAVLPWTTLMEKRGVQVNEPVRLAHEKWLSFKIEELRVQIASVAELCGVKEYNSRSHLQTRKLFVDTLGCRVLKRSKDSGNPSFDEEVMAKYQFEADDERARMLAKLIVEMRGFDKLLGTYVDTIRGDKAGIYHPSFNIVGTISGRWSSKHIQVMPKPVKNKKTGEVLVPGMRDIFCARPGHTLIACDYAQLEVRVTAILSHASNMLRWFKEGKDVYTSVAGDLYGEANAKAARDSVKAVVLGKMYGRSDAAIANSLNLSLGAINKLMGDFRRKHPEIFVASEQAIAFANEFKYSQAEILGRRRYFFDDEVPETEPFNFRIQSTASAIVDMALLRIAPQLRWDAGEGIIAQIHDDITVECPDSEVPRVARLLRDAMQHPVELAGAMHSFSVELKTGKNLGEMAVLHLDG